MSISATSTDRVRSRRGVPPRSIPAPTEPVSPTSRGASTARIAPRRIASNFAALSLAEIVCRGTSVAVTLYLAQQLGTVGFGRIEFAFNVVFWLVLLVREGLDLLASREIARHPRLVRPLVNQVLAIRGLLAITLLAGLVTLGGLTLTRSTDRLVLSLYGLMLLTTSLGIDFVFRGLERMGLVAISLMIRTSVYAVGVGLLVSGPDRLVWVPVCLVLGETCGIALVWFCYARRFGLPRPSLRGNRTLMTIIHRGRPVYLIQVAQAVLGSVDLLIVALMSGWSNVGLYSAPHRMVTAVLTFGLIFQQVVFPSLARSWRDTPAASRALNALVRVLVLVLLPLAIGTTVLAPSLVRFLFGPEYQDAAWLLAVGIWRAPLLTLAFLYQTTLIALNRESSGVRMLLIGAFSSVPLVSTMRWGFGLHGAVVGSILIGLILVLGGYARLAAEGRNPVWHHHLGRPLLASAMMVPVCLALLRFHVLVAILGGALIYFIALFALGGLRRADLRTILGRA